MRNKVAKGITAILIAGVLAAGVCCAGFASRDQNGKWFRNSDLKSWHWKDKTGGTSEADDGIQDGSLIVGDMENVAGVRLRSARIAPEEYEEYGISAYAESAVTVTVENIQPASATDKTIEWTAAFGEAVDSSWQGNMGGKTVKEYVTVTPSEDTQSVTVECTQAFGAPVIVMGTFQSNKGLQLSFTCNYLAKVVEDTVTMSFKIAHGEAVEAFEYNGDYQGGVEIDFSVGTLFPVISGYATTVSLGKSFDFYISGSGLDDLDSHAMARSVAVSPEDHIFTNEDFMKSFFVEGTDFYNRYTTVFHGICAHGESVRSGGKACTELKFTCNYTVTYNGVEIAEGTVTKDMIFKPFEIPVEDANLSDSEILF